MAQYYDISLQEMSDFLVPQGFKQISLDGVQEVVFGRRVDFESFPLTLRVYTGISKYGGHSRMVGKDAIRVNLFYRKNDRIFKLGGSKRVHRVMGWKANLQSRLDDWLNHPLEKCKKCGSLMVPRKTKTGKVFLGCTSYPECRG